MSFLPTVVANQVISPGLVWIETQSVPERLAVDCSNALIEPPLWRPPWQLQEC